MTSTIDPATTLAQIVTDHPDLARELEARDLDYCCGGQRSLGDACRTAGLDADAVAAELAAVADHAGPEAWLALDAASLVDHLEATHHAYLHAELPRLATLLAKVHGVHGANHPELSEVAETFAALRADLEPHLAKEERVLFPLIRDLVRGTTTAPFAGGSVQSPIAVMRREHDHAGRLLGLLRRHTSGYLVPPDGCASFAALYQGLEQLEADTHLHVHKENNRLFPLVAELEARTAEQGSSVSLAGGSR